MSSHRLAGHAAICVALAITGCTNLQLRRNTSGQMSTVHELQQQQVLDNLAMFVHNLDSYPYFSVVSQGTSTLQDTGTLAVTNGWGLTAVGAFMYNALGVNPMWSRQHTGAWTINPINDSIKLSVMRCVYRRAVQGCIGTTPDGCPDCDKLFYAYYNIEPPLPWSNSIPYLGGPSNNPADPSNNTVISNVAILAAQPENGFQKITAVVPSIATDQYQGFIITIDGPDGPEARVVVHSLTDADQRQQTHLLVSPPFTSPIPENTPCRLMQSARPPIRGSVTPECLSFDRCWFCYGSRLPRHCGKCNLVGHYCGTYVWVPPSGVDQLTKVTMLIQDIAYFDPPTVGQKLVATSATGNLGGAATAAGAGTTTTTIFMAPRHPTFYPYSQILGLNQLLQTGPAPR